MIFYGNLFGCLSDVYENYLKTNQRSILQTSKMIRFLTILVKKEETLLSRAKTPKLISITQKCSDSVIKESGLDEIESKLSSLCYERDKSVHILKQELSKINSMIRSQLIDKNSANSKNEERAIRIEFQTIDEETLKFKNKIESLKDMCKIMGKNIKNNLKLWNKKKSMDYNYNDTMKDFIIILKQVKDCEDSLFSVLNLYMSCWKNFKMKVVVRLTKIKKILEFIVEFQKNSFFRTIRMEMIEEKLTKFDPKKLTNDIYNERNLLKSQNMKTLGLESEKLEDLKEKITTKHKSFPDNLDFCIWDHYNSGFIKEDGFTQLKLRFFITNENYFYIYKVENRSELPIDESPEFLSRVDNLKYHILKNEEFLLIKVRVGYYDKKKNTRKQYQLIAKDVKDKYDLIKILKKYGKREEFY